MPLEFEGRPIVVTGATGELGSALVEVLLEAGAVCWLPVRRAGRLASLVERAPDRVHVVEGVDPTDEAAVRAFYVDLPGLWASLHCVGAFALGPIAESSLEEQQRMHAVNATSAYLCSREAVRRMRRGDGGGRIVNVAARQALEPRRGAGAVAYAMSKAAVAALTVALAAEVAGEGLLVNAVAPSTLDTPANRAAMPDADHGAWPAPREVAATMAWLASPRQTTVQGTIVTAYGRG
jgi:NAD(P)-dependent dehydrogenase (short-subunit alcohol dehydrogenase family)